jgi:hypothetical protein
MLNPHVDVDTATGSTGILRDLHPGKFSRSAPSKVDCVVMPVSSFALI